VLLLMAITTANSQESSTKDSKKAVEAPSDVQGTESKQKPDAAESKQSEVAAEENGETAKNKRGLVHLGYGYGGYGGSSGFSGTKRIFEEKKWSALYVRSTFEAFSLILSFIYNYKRGYIYQYQT